MGSFRFQDGGKCPVDVEWVRLHNCTFSAIAKLQIVCLYFRVKMVHMSLSFLFLLFLMKHLTPLV